LTYIATRTIGQVEADTKQVSEIPAIQKPLAGIRPFAHAAHLRIMDPRLECRDKGGQLDFCFGTKEAWSVIVDLELRRDDVLLKKDTPRTVSLMEK
jgi:hypothetical protein